MVTEVGVVIDVGVVTEVGGICDVTGAVKAGVPAPPTERRVREVGGGAMGGATGEPAVPPDGKGAANFLVRAAGGGGGSRVFTVVTTSSGFCAGRTGR